MLKLTHLHLPLHDFHVKHLPPHLSEANEYTIPQFLINMNSFRVDK
jgi:hypothetical protein